MNGAFKVKENKFQFALIDFEAFLEDVETCFPDPNKSSVSCNTKFEACSYGHQIICSDERYTKSLSFAQVQTQFSFYFRKLPRRGIKTKEFFLGKTVQ